VPPLRDREEVERERLLEEPERDDPPLRVDREEPELLRERDELLERVERDELEPPLRVEREDVERPRVEPLRVEPLRVEPLRDDDEDELVRLRLDDERLRPVDRCDAGISSVATAFVSCGISRARKFDMRSSSRRMRLAS
jgi:hypothetical protein